MSDESKPAAGARTEEISERDWETLCQMAEDGIGGEPPPTLRRLSPELRAASEASWKRNEAAYRYLDGDKGQAGRA